MAQQEEIGMRLSRLEPAVIAVDGPAASGKSTVGFHLARKINFLFFDTGAMYRAVTWVALATAEDVEDVSAIGDLAEVIEIDVLPPRQSDSDGRQCTVLVKNEDITAQIRMPVVDRNVSVVSANPRVRRALSGQQRRIGLRYGGGSEEKPGIVMVGRDIGTVVMPDAPVKIYLDASVEVRSERRYAELVQRGKPATFEKIRLDILRRDKLDSDRALSPLRIAEEATVIDTSDLTPEDVVQRIILSALKRLDTPD